MYQPYPGQAQLPETQRPPAPASVLTAVKVMYAGAAASILGIVIDILTVNATKTAIQKRSPHLSASQINSVLFALSTVDTFVGLTAPIALAVKLWGALVWLIALTAIVLLWRRSSSAFFKPTRS